MRVLLAVLSLLPVLAAFKLPRRPYTVHSLKITEILALLNLTTSMLNAMVHLDLSTCAAVSMHMPWKRLSHVVTKVCVYAAGFPASQVVLCVGG